MIILKKLHLVVLLLALTLTFSCDVLAEEDKDNDSGNSTDTVYFYNTFNVNLPGGDKIYDAVVYIESGGNRLYAQYDADQQGYKFYNSIERTYYSEVVVEIPNAPGISEYRESIELYSGSNYFSDISLSLEYGYSERQIYIYSPTDSLSGNSILEYSIYSDSYFTKNLYSSNYYRFITKQDINVIIIAEGYEPLSEKVTDSYYPKLTPVINYPDPIDVRISGNLKDSDTRNNISSSTSGRSISTAGENASLDSSGGYTLNTKTINGQVIIIAGAMGYNPAQYSVRPTSSSLSKDIYLTKMMGTMQSTTVSGYINVSSSSNYDEAVVIVGGQSTTISSSGYYSVNVQNMGSVVITVTYPGYYPETTTLDVANSTSKSKTFYLDKI